VTTTTTAVLASTRPETHSGPRRGVVAAVALLFAFALGACDMQAKQEQKAAAAAAQAQEQEAAKNLAVYNDLRAKQSWELASSIGKDLVTRFPNSAQAATVNQTLAETEAKATEIREQKRLTQLWTYQSGEESGGQQNTASIYSDETVPEEQRVRLVLRRHTSWGESAYLVSPGEGFECEKECTLAVSIDGGEPEKLKAVLPETTDPAILIDDHEGFIGKLDQATKVSIELKQKGKEPQTVVFEVAGFDPAKFPAPTG
jgi:muconolactone delta-isomerase